MKTSRKKSEWVDVRPPSEFSEQELVCQWLDLQYPDIVYFSVPNEGKRSDKMKYHMHRTGMLSGAPDLVIITGKKVFFLEMKRSRGGHLSPAQSMVHSWIRALGHTVLVAHGFDNARAALLEHLPKRKRGKNQASFLSDPVYEHKFKPPRPSRLR